MRERITALGGAVQRDGAAGTRIRVTLPLEAETSAGAASASESVRPS